MLEKTALFLRDGFPYGGISSVFGGILSVSGGMSLLGEHYHFYIDRVGARFNWGHIITFGGEVLLGAIIIIWGHDY